MNNGKMWIEILKQVGFPVVVAMILLIQVTPAVNRLTGAIERQNVLLERLEKATEDNQRLLGHLLLSLLDGGNKGPRGR